MSTEKPGPIKAPSPILLGAIGILAAESIAREEVIERVWKVVDDLACEVAADRVAFHGDVRTTAADVRRRLWVALTEALGERPL